LIPTGLAQSRRARTRLRALNSPQLSVLAAQIIIASPVPRAGIIFRAFTLFPTFPI